MQFRKNFIVMLAALLLSNAAAQETVPVVDELGEFITQLEQRDALSSKENAHVGYIVSTYGIAENEAREIVSHARRLEDPVYPRYADILGIVEVESAFKRLAKSKGDCVGLMQLKYMFHRQGLRSKRELMHIGVNMEKGSAYLRELFSQLKGNVSGTVMAYRVGPGSYKSGLRDRKYLAKINKAKRNFS